jgi:hypothetical protein
MDPTVIVIPFDHPKDAQVELEEPTSVAHGTEVGDRGLTRLESTSA